jgi:hypothetical protein
MNGDTKAGNIGSADNMELDIDEMTRMVVIDALKRASAMLEDFDMFDPKVNVTEFAQPRSLTIAEELTKANPNQDTTTD